MTTKAPSPIDPAGLPLGWNVQANGNEALTGNTDLASFSGALTNSGLIAESFDPALATAGYALSVAGSIYAGALVVPPGATVTNLWFNVSIVGGTLTTNCFGVLVSQASGVVEGVTATQATNWATIGVCGAAGTGVPLTTPATGLLGGTYYVGLAYAGASGPSISALPGPVVSAAGLSNLNRTLAKGNLNYAVLNTGMTLSNIAAASPFVLNASPAAIFNQALWVGVN